MYQDKINHFTNIILNIDHNLKDSLNLNNKIIMIREKFHHQVMVLKWMISYVKPKKLLVKLIHRFHLCKRRINLISHGNNSKCRHKTITEDKTFLLEIEWMIENIEILQIAIGIMNVIEIIKNIHKEIQEIEGVIALEITIRKEIIEIIHKKEIIVHLVMDMDLEIIDKWVHVETIVDIIIIKTDMEADHIHQVQDKSMTLIWREGEAILHHQDMITNREIIDNSQNQIDIVETINTIEEMIETLIVHRVECIMNNKKK